MASNNEEINYLDNSSKLAQYLIQNEDKLMKLPEQYQRNDGTTLYFDNQLKLVFIKHPNIINIIEDKWSIFKKSE
jgi:hypothetical protein